MYIPKHFIESDQEKLRRLAATYPLATLVVTNSISACINHLPMLWIGDELQGHVAVSNKLVDLLDQPQAATAIFHGPQGYVTPNNYPSKARNPRVVPTWNYAVVHLSGTLRRQQDSDWITQQVQRLTTTQERNPLRPWQMRAAPAAFTATMLKAICGVVLSIDSIEAKFKLSQNRSTEDIEGGRAGLTANGGDALAEFMA
jgi:transcriptional regulator